MEFPYLQNFAINRILEYASYVSKCDRTSALLSVRRYSPVTWVMIRGWQVWQGAALPSSSSEFHWQQIVFLILLNNLLISAPPPTWWWALPIHWGIPWGLEATLWFWNPVNFFLKFCQLFFEILSTSFWSHYGSETALELFAKAELMQADLKMVSFSGIWSLAWKKQERS